MANVFGLGAVGDGVADDTDALQHALNVDGVLRLNKGTYRITKPLVLDLKQRGFGAVRGEAGTSRIVMTGPGPAPACDWRSSGNRFAGERSGSHMESGAVSHDQQH